MIAGMLTTAVYFLGYSSHNQLCLSHCSLTYGPSHLGRMIQYFVLLVGDILPSSKDRGSRATFGCTGFQGAVSLLRSTAGCRADHARSGEPNPTRFRSSLIALALLFDLITPPWPVSGRGCKELWTRGTVGTRCPTVIPAQSPS